MLTGGSHLWAGRLRVYCRGLGDVLGRYPHRPRPDNIRLKQWSSSAPCKASPPKPDVRKVLSRWSILVLVVGQEGRPQVVKQAWEVLRYLLCMVARQSEVHTSQELRRALHLYCTYSRLWGEEAARNMMASLRRALSSKGRHLLLSAVCFSNFNWDQEKISDDRLQESVKDLENVGELCQATVECETCGKRQVIDQKMVDVDYCLCEGSLGYTSDMREYESWHPFIEREHHIVWRRRHPVHNHLFAYKVYGSYDDVSLSSFMETQLNSNYRTEWDDTALQLKVLESQQQSNSDLMYWLVKFPHFFANRDYVFKRRFMINTEKREAVIMGEAVACPDVVPEEKGIHRVTEYWSTMVIRARGEMDQPGIEYTLTYFDNPGTSLPQSITNFVAWTGFPNFLKKLHKAALHLQACHEKGDDVYVSLPAVLRYPRRLRKDLEKLPELEVPSDEVQVFVQSSEAVVVKDDNIGALSDEKLFAETQDELSTVIAMPVTSGVIEGSDNETPGGDETRMQEDPTTTNVPSDGEEIGSCVEGYSGSFEKNMSLSAEPSKETTSDKSLHVNIGGKKIYVDLLEAMEVVAPDLERKSLLVRKIEELIEMLKDNEKQSIILQKLHKLRHKLKSFQEDAVMKRERSMRHMEQLSNRDHYHMNVDDKTLKHLELLFEAMKYVIQADRDMRTGKTLLEGDSAVKSTPDEADNLKKTQTTDFPGQSSTPNHPRKYGDDQPPDDNKLADPKSSKKTKKKSKMRPPPEEPPPPAPTVGEWQEGETNGEADDMKNSEGGNIANELGNIAKSVNNVNVDVNESRSWFAGVSIPYISAWWEAGSRQGVASSECPSDVTKLLNNNAVSDPDAQTNTLLAQILYVITLRWIFYSEGDEDSTLSQQNSIKSPHSKQEDSEESNCPGEPRWYWYPFSGAYRVYAWVFSASGVNA